MNDRELLREEDRAARERALLADRLDLELFRPVPLYAWPVLDRLDAEKLVGVPSTDKEIAERIRSIEAYVAAGIEGPILLADRRRTERAKSRRRYEAGTATHSRGWTTRNRIPS